jgi:AcrR family transcriptional regulator
MKSKVAAVVLNKHQVKTEATISGVLDASEKVFVRDGYERAQIETIAAEAGRTKGSIYSHFRSKEDIFFALIERKAQLRREEFLRSTEREDPRQRVELVKRLFLRSLEDESWPILMLEFKLLALRNKASLERIRELYRLLYEDMSRVLQTEAGVSTVLTRQRDVIAFAVLRGIPSAVILEKQFNPHLISTAVAREVFESIFDALLKVEDERLAPRASGATKKAKRSFVAKK